MDKDSRSLSPVLFTVRLWQEDLGDGQVEWRGEVKNLTSGEVRYFRQWSLLARLLPRMIDDASMPGPSGEEESLSPK